MKVINGEYMVTEGSARTTGLPYDRDCSHDDCYAPASAYWVIYDHNELANQPCGLRRSVILLVPYCKRHSEAVAMRESLHTHSQCMAQRATLPRVERLFA